MEYYIVRIYRRGPGQFVGGRPGDMQITGQVEDDSGHKETFHDAETLWQSLMHMPSGVETEGPKRKA